MNLRPADITARQANDIDARYHPSATVRRQLNKVFPTHWSFLLGEIALYSFVVLLITGIYLTLFFDPSMTEVTYNGVYQPLRGIEMSRAYASALNISFEVRGGLFVRQVHHWAALMFAASIMVHLARVFFTGAFRRPREANWVIGALLLILAMFEGYFGYSLPDDLLSGIGLRAALSSITLGFPVVGTWLHWALFSGDFPGTTLIPRLYALHILVLPAIILALIGAHLAMVWFQKHTQFPDLEPWPLQPVSGVGGIPAGLLHDVAGRLAATVAGMGDLRRPSHGARGVRCRDDHGRRLRPADHVPVPGEAVQRRPGSPQPAAAAA